MDKMVCKNCAHFHQHYALDERRIFRVYCGHCMLRCSKKKQPDTAACDSFTPAPPDENAFATKEYLSKQLLQYLLCLDLPPEIGESEYLDPQRK